VTGCSVLIPSWEHSYKQLPSEKFLRQNTECSSDFRIRATCPKHRYAFLNWLP
jgi:hypothetical protein